MSISFWAQNQAAHAAASAANDRLFNDNTVSKLFTGGNPSASKVPSVLSTESPMRSSTRSARFSSTAR